MDPVPTVNEIYQVTESVVHISVNERSEDNGDGLRAITYLYYNSNHGPGVVFQNYREFDPGRIDVEKQLTLDWDVPVGFLTGSVPSCVPLTLIVTHKSNVDNTTNKHFPIDNDDVASLTWFLSVNNPDGKTITCPVGPGQ